MTTQKIVFQVSEEEVKRTLTTYAQGRALLPKDIASFTEQLQDRLRETLDDWAEEFFQE